MYHERDTCIETLISTILFSICNLDLITNLNNKKGNLYVHTIYNQSLVFLINRQ